MFKKVLIAAAIVITSPAFTSAQYIFWSLDSTRLVTSVKSDGVLELTNSVYIFSDGEFGFDALDLDFTISFDEDTIRLTGGEAFNPTSFIGSQRFDASELTITADGTGGNLFSVAVIASGISPVLAQFDPLFEPGVGPNGAFLLARLDF